MVKKMQISSELDSVHENVCYDNCCTLCDQSTYECARCKSLRLKNRKYKIVRYTLNLCTIFMMAMSVFSMIYCHIKCVTLNIAITALAFLVIFVIEFILMYFNIEISRKISEKNISNCLFTYIFVRCLQILLNLIITIINPSPVVINDDAVPDL